MAETWLWTGVCIGVIGGFVLGLLFSLWVDRDVNRR